MMSRYDTSLCNADGGQGEPSRELGSAEALLSRPPLDVTGDASWLSVLGFWLLLPINLLMAIVGALSDSVLRCYTSLVMRAVAAGRPLCFTPR